MDNPFESIRLIQDRFHPAGVLTIVIGGMAVSVWGEPRLTRDVDLKVLCSRNQADLLLNLLEPEYTSLLADPRQTLRQQGILFVQDQLNTRIDLLLADTPYDVQAIQRGCEVEVQPGLWLRICSPEDLVIYKLISTRPRDHEDVRGILRRQGDGLDDTYILDWLHQFEQALDDSTLVSEYLRLRGKG